MADRYPARIFIGGDIPRTLVPELKEAMEISPEEDELLWSSGALREFEGRYEQDYGIMLVNARFPGTLCIYDVYATNGEFPELVNFCQANNLPFIMESDAGAEYEAVITWWTPQVAGQKYTLASNQGEPLTDTREVLKIIDDLLQLAADGELGDEEQRQAVQLTITGKLKMPPTTLPPFIMEPAHGQ